MYKSTLCTIQWSLVLDKSWTQSRWAGTHFIPNLMDISNRSNAWKSGKLLAPIIKQNVFSDWNVSFSKVLKNLKNRRAQKTSLFNLTHSAVDYYVYSNIHLCYVWMMVVCTCCQFKEPKFAKKYNSKPEKLNIY
jgi:hypothetical protein